MGAVGRPNGLNLTAEAHADVLLKHAEAGAGYIYLPICTYVTDETVRKVKERAKPVKMKPQFKPGVRFIKASTPFATYGVEGMFSIVTHASWMTIDSDLEDMQHSLDVMKIIKKKKPADVKLIANTRGYGDLPDSYAEVAGFWEEQGVDLIELNLSCPAQPASAGAVEDYFEQTFDTRWPGCILGQLPEKVEDITREVVKAVNVIGKRPRHK